MLGEVVVLQHPPVLVAHLVVGVGVGLDDLPARKREGAREMPSVWMCVARACVGGGGDCQHTTHTTHYTHLPHSLITAGVLVHEVVVHKSRVLRSPHLRLMIRPPLAVSAVLEASQDYSGLAVHLGHAQALVLGEVSFFLDTGNGLGLALLDAVASFSLD